MPPRHHPRRRRPCVACHGSPSDRLSGYRYRPPRAAGGGGLYRWVWTGHRRDHPGLYTMGDSLHLRSGVHVRARPIPSCGRMIRHRPWCSTATMARSSDLRPMPPGLSPAAASPVRRPRGRLSRDGDAHRSGRGNVLHLAQPLLADYPAHGAAPSADSRAERLPGARRDHRAPDDRRNRDQRPPDGLPWRIFVPHYGTRIAGCTVRRFLGMASALQSDDVVVEDCLW